MSNIAVSDVRKQPFYSPLLEQCRKIDARTKAVYWELVLCRTQLGWAIENTDIDPRYGESTISALAADLGYSDAVIYRAVQMGQRFPTLESLEQFKAECEANGISPSLTYIRKNILPDPMRKPQSIGEHVASVEDSMRKIETLAMEMEKLATVLNSNGLDVDKRREAAGVLIQAQDVMRQTAAALEPEISPAAKIHRNTGYLDYIRSLPCVICDAPAEPHHVERGGVALKGSDYATVPLCRKHHSELHNRGKHTFEEWQGIELWWEVARSLIGYFVKEKDHETDGH